MQAFRGASLSLCLIVSWSAVACSPGTHGAASTAPTTASRGTPRVGPPHGTVIVVGGGAQGPEVFAKFIEAAGGPDALIVDVPTAGGDSTYPPDWRGANGLKAAGAKHVVVLHTIHREVANADSFVAPLKTAGGVWFEGGRHFHLVDSYLGTKTEQGFHDILERGGVMAGSSAGASILGDFLVRGAPSNNNFIMDYPGYEKGFAFLRGVGIDQHVVARERLADLADSIMPRHPELLAISEDEGTAWVVQGDVAEIIGRNKAFVYGGKDATDPGKPFLTLRPGDRYDLAARHVIHRAIDESPVTQKFVDGLFAGYTKAGGPMATVLVAQNGKVLIDASYNVPPQARFMPTTTVPNFDLGAMSDALNASVLMAAMRPATGGRGGGGRGGRGGPSASTPPRAVTLLDTIAAGVTVRDYLTHAKTVPGGSKTFAGFVAARGGVSYSQIATTAVYTPIGMHKTAFDSTRGEFQSNVDELYRFELGLTANRALTTEGTVNVFAPANGTGTGAALGWNVDQYKGVTRESAYGRSDGKRNAFVRFPDRRAAIIILTNDETADARAIADKIADRLLSGGR